MGSMRILVSGRGVRSVVGNEGRRGDGVSLSFDSKAKRGSSGGVGWNQDRGGIDVQTGAVIGSGVRSRSVLGDSRAGLGSEFKDGRKSNAEKRERFGAELGSYPARSGSEFHSRSYAEAVMVDDWKRERHSRREGDVSKKMFVEASADSQSLKAQYACRFKEHVSDIEVTPRQTDMKEGNPAVQFSMDEIHQGAEKFRFCLVMKFLNGRPPARDLQRLISAHWGPQMGFVFSEIWDSHHVIVRLGSEEDLIRGLACRLRRIGSKFFKLFRWFPEYNPLEDNKFLRAWIRLPRIPLFLYDKAFAAVIVSSFSRLIRLDENTEKCRNLFHMRLNIELKVGSVIPEKVWIDLPDGRGFWQFIELEGPTCFNCRVADHKNEDCPKFECSKGGESEEAKDPDIIKDDSQQVQAVESEDNDSEWQIVTHNKRKRKKAILRMGQATIFRMGGRKPVRATDSVESNGSQRSKEGEENMALVPVSVENQSEGGCSKLKIAAGSSKEGSQPLYVVSNFQEHNEEGGVISNQFCSNIARSNVLEFNDELGVWVSADGLAHYQKIRDIAGSLSIVQ